MANEKVHVELLPHQLEYGALIDKLAQVAIALLCEDGLPPQTTPHVPRSEHVS